MSWIHEYPGCIYCRSTEPVRSFYETYFSADTVLDLGWYLSLNIPGCRQMLRFMALCDDWVSRNRPGQTYNIEVPDVHREFGRLLARKLQPLTPVQTFQWGDHAFYVMDPVGLLLYIHSEGQPSPEMLDCIRKFG